MKKAEIKYLFFIPLIYLSFILFHKFAFINIITLDIGGKGGHGAAGLPLLALSILIAVFIICYFFPFIRIYIYKKSFLSCYIFLLFCVTNINWYTKFSDIKKLYYSNDRWYNPVLWFRCFIRTPNIFTS